MRTLFRFSLACVLAIVAVAKATACAPSSVGRTATGALFKIELEVSWSDERILRALGLDPVGMKRSLVVGVDGEQNIFKNRKGTVSIVRSIATGIYVIYSQDKKNFVEWELCEVSPNNSIQRTSDGAADR